MDTLLTASGNSMTLYNNVGTVPTITSNATTITASGVIPQHFLTNEIPNNASLPLKPIWSNLENSLVATNTSIYSNSDKTLLSYISKQIFNLIPNSELYDRINYYESKYKISTEEFYEKWVNGTFEDNFETNEWISLHLQLQGIK